MHKYTLGIEGEFTICEKDGSVAAPKKTVPFIKQVVKSNPKHYEQEFLASCIEVKTGIDTVPSEAVGSFFFHSSNLLKRAREQGLFLMAASTHPTMDWRQEEAFESEHNNDVSNATPFGGMRYISSGLHVHVGCDAFNEDRDAMVAIMQGISFYLPVFLAMTANSPFFDGLPPSGFASYRASNILVGEEPFGGVLPNFASFNEYQQCLNTLSKVLPGVNINADVRLNAKYNTIEVRIMDMTVSKPIMVHVVTLIQALISRLHRAYEVGELTVYPRWITQANRWNAAHFGMDAEGIILKDGSVGTMRTALCQLIKYVEDDLSSKNAAECLLEAVSFDSPSCMQLNTYNYWRKHLNSHEEVMQKLCESLVLSTTQAFI